MEMGLVERLRTPFGKQGAQPIKTLLAERAEAADELVRLRGRMEATLNFFTSDGRHAFRVAAAIGHKT